jgi:hypothetical protein
MCYRRFCNSYQQSEKPWELYDIDADRAEMHDLAKKDPQKTLEMIELWTDWARHNQVSFPKRFNMYDFLKKQKAKGNQSPLSPDS